MMALLLVLLGTPSWDLAEMARLEAEVFGRGRAVGDAAALSFLPPPELTTELVEAPESAEVAAADLKLQGMQVPVTLNANVRAYIDFFTGRGRPIYAKWLARKGRYEKLMLPILEQHGVPPEMIYVCMIESGFTNDAVSPASAVGPWQFMRRTGGAYGLTVDDWVDERRDPVKATEAAARHLKDLYENLGSWPLVMAAYNAGAGYLNRGVKRANSNEFWRLVEADTLPDQAQNYVPKAMAAMIIGREPARYGFGEVRPEPPIQFKVASVPGGLDLTRFARSVGVPVADLLDLNPELRRGVTPPGEIYPLKVPPDVVARVEEAARGSKVPLVEHRVRFGERVRHIAADFGIHQHSVRRMNDLADDEEPEAGRLLVLPRGEQAPEEPDEVIVLTEPGVEFDAQGRQLVYFPVRWSQSVDDVAAFFGVSPGQVAMWNGLDPAVPLQRGMALRLYVARDFDVRRAVTVDPKTVTVVAAGTEAAVAALDRAQEEPLDKQQYTSHTVGRGENLWKVAKKYGMSVQALREENGMRKGEGAKLGQVLRIPVGGRTAKAGKPAREVEPPPAPREVAAREKPARGEKPAPARVAAEKPAREKPAREKPAREKPARPSGRGMRYTVKAGDSLYEVAERYDVSLRALRDVNSLPANARLKAGQVLIIP